MSLTKEEFDKRLDEILVKLHLQGDINGDLGRDTDGGRMLTSILLITVYVFILGCLSIRRA